MRSSEEQLRRRLWLDLPHVRPLVEIVRVIQRELGSHYIIPMPDPLDGGCDARVLILLEAPGPRAIETGFISLDNPDPTANTLRELLANAGVARSDVLMWNSVPWFIVDDNGNNVAPNKDEHVRARPYLAFVLHQLPRLRAVLLMGKHAQQGWDTFAWPRPMSTYRTNHPSARGLARAEAQKEALATIRELAAELRRPTQAEP
jgi:uracil-DNA glycosylase